MEILTKLNIKEKAEINFNDIRQRDSRQVELSKEEISRLIARYNSGIKDKKEWFTWKIGRGDTMTNMTLKELMEYERELCSLQQEYEGKLTKIYGEADSSNEKRRLTIVLNLIIEERQKVNRQKYKPVN